MMRTKRQEPEQPIIYALLQEDPLRELFEACKSGDLNKVRRQINAETVNARDTTGRKSTPLHFAAGKCQLFFVSSSALKYIFVFTLLVCISFSIVMLI